jgi:hypothetical protein
MHPNRQDNEGCPGARSILEPGPLEDHLVDDDVEAEPRQNSYRRVQTRDKSSTQSRGLDRERLVRWIFGWHIPEQLRPDGSSCDPTGRL